MAGFPKCCLVVALDYLTPEQVEQGETPDTVNFIERSELVHKTALDDVLKWYERRTA